MDCELFKAQEDKLIYGQNILNKEYSKYLVQ